MRQSLEYQGRSHLPNVARLAVVHEAPLCPMAGVRRAAGS